MALGAVIVLTLNSGSSSLKFGLYRVKSAKLEPLMTGEAENGELQAQDAHGAPLVGTPLAVASDDTTVGAISSLLATSGLPAPEAIGHRIVHGGAKLRAHCLIDDAVERDLEGACALSPLHGPAALAIIRSARDTWPGVAQAACLDTTFHAGMPDIARVLPVSKELRDEGVERYGFHGLSCESIVRQLEPDVPARLIVAHLGSGASVTAIRDGRSVDTSMGLTPSGGVIMATRSGDLDPGISIYLLREKGFDAARLEDIIDHHSGLLGISSLSGDMRELHAAAQTNPDAQLAIAIFCMSVAKAIAGMFVVLGGVDAIVFTGGVGEHDPAVRGAIGDLLGSLGICLDQGLNEAGHDRISCIGMAPDVRILPSREDDEIARHAATLVRTTMRPRPCS